jgi:hypothetical protein
MPQPCLRRFRQSLFFLTVFFSDLRSSHFGPRFRFALLLDCAAYAHIVCAWMGLTVAVSKSVAVVVALLPWKLASVISEKQFGGCENTPSALSIVYFVSVWCGVMVYGVVS